MSQSSCCTGQLTPIPFGKFDPDRSWRFLSPAASLPGQDSQSLRLSSSCFTSINQYCLPYVRLGLFITLLQAHAERETMSTKQICYLMIVVMLSTGYATDAGQQEQVSGTACRGGDGTWIVQ
jgi:hypothetical protein